MDNENVRTDRTWIADRRLTSFTGLVAGGLAGIATAALAGTALAHRLAASPSVPVIEATHLPPLLTVPNEPIELRYDVYCVLPEDGQIDAPCDASGTVFVRTGGVGGFRALPLREDRTATEGRFFARVPDTIAASRAGFSYYAAFRSTADRTTATLPAGGADAPHRSLPLGRSVTVRLGAHSFGFVRGADSRVAEAAWGTGPGEAGLEQGRNLPPIGGSAFDVDRSGTVYVLDEANRRLLRWSNGARASVPVPLSISGTLADMSVGEDQAIYVLESTVGQNRAPLLRVFGPDGSGRGAIEVAERASQIRIGPNGPVLLQQPSGQWMTAAADGRILTQTAQESSGRAGRPLPDGSEVVILRHDNEVRAALVGPGGVRQAWRVTSETPLAEIQLAEPFGDGLLLVVRVYTTGRDEFLVLVVDKNGLAQRFSLDSADWAETAPLSRFRLVGSSLYQLGSTPGGLFVDRVDLEAR
jgi:hypothetical protein